MKCLMYVIGFAFLITLAVALMPAVHAELISVDPCQGNIFITQKDGFFNLYSKCFTVSIAGDYSSAVFRDEYGKVPFELFIDSYQDGNADNLDEFKEFMLRDFGMKGEFNNDGNGVVFTSGDGTIRVNYFIKDNKFEVSYEQDKWISNFKNGMLVIDTIATKDAKAAASFVNKPANVDSVIQPLSMSKNNVDKGVIKQVAFIGNSFDSLVLDPLYQVDYSPIPAQWLINGTVNSYNDSQFGSLLNITAGVSDNNDSTSYALYNGTCSGTCTICSAFSSSATCIAQGGCSWIFYTSPETINPSDNGTYTTLNISGCTQNWQCVSGAGYVYSDKSYYLNDTYNFQNLSLDFDIDRVYILIFANKGNSSGNANMTPVLITHGIEYAGLTYNITSMTPSSPTTVTYYVNPFTNSSWTKDEINNLEVGVMLAATDTTSQVTTITIYVFEKHYYCAGTCASCGTYSYSNSCIGQSGCSWGWNGNAIDGRWNAAYNPVYQWWLRVKKVTAGNGNFTVYGYNSNNSIEPTKVTTVSMSGTGWFNVNVSDIMHYETNTLGWNFTALRFFSQASYNFSEVQLRKEVNDTSPPQFSNCSINNTALTNNQVARLSCDVTDNVDVAYANGTVNGSVYNFTKNDDSYYYDFTCTHTNVSIQWNQMQALDIMGNYNSTNPSLSFNCTYYSVTYDNGILISNFNFSSTSYVTVMNISFNTSQYDQIFTLSTAFSLKGISLNSSSDVWMKCIVDGSDVLEGFVANVENNYDIRTTAAFVGFFVPDIGSHYVEVLMKKSGYGDISIKDVNAVMSKTIDIEGYVSQTYAYSGEFDHIGTGFVNSSPIEIDKAIDSDTLVVAILTHSSNSSGYSEYRMRRVEDNATSNVWFTSFTSSSSHKVSAGVWMIPSGIMNFSIVFDAKNNASYMNTSVYYDLIAFDMSNSIGNPMNHFIHSNPLTNGSNMITLSAGLTRIMNYSVHNYVGDGMLFCEDTSLQALTGNITASQFINVSGLSNCTSAKGIYTSYINEIRNVKDISKCSGMVGGNDYIVEVWINISSGSMNLLDESIVGVESRNFDVIKGAVAPFASSIITPANGSFVNNYVNATWGKFVDDNGDFSFYNITLSDSHGNIYVINDSGVLEYQFINVSSLANGEYSLTVTGCDTMMLCSNSSVMFYMLNFGSDVIGSASLYYPPFGMVGNGSRIDAIVNVSGRSYPYAAVFIYLDGVIAPMYWDNITRSYGIIWVPSLDGVYPFNVTASTMIGNYTIYGTIYVAAPYQVCMSVWTNVNMTAGSEYKNEFAWIFATLQNGSQTLHTIFEAGDKFTCPPEANIQCMWHARYVNGTACMDLFMPGNYTFWLIGNDIEWKQDIGSGYVMGCDFCEYRAITKHLLFNLGTYTFNGDMNEDFDLYQNPAELYYGGAFFGFLASWAFLIVDAIIGILAFVFTLYATGSVKSALLMMVLLPTLIHGGILLSGYLP